MAHFESEILTVDRSVAREVVGTRLVSARIISAVLAIALGMTILSVVGFAPNDFIHAAAHDVRHSARFPCQRDDHVVQNVLRSACRGGSSWCLSVRTSKLDDSASSTSGRKI